MQHNNNKFIINYLNSSKRRLKYCEDAFKEKDFAYVIRQLQEVVELCSKALLFRWNIVIPQKHDISENLEEIQELFSENFQKNLLDFIKLSKRLRREREFAFYGDQKGNKSPDEIYDEKDTETLFLKTKEFYNICREELKEILKE